MNSASYVGRVGGLAVVLGVGAAVVTGFGLPVAWADTPSSTESSSTSSPESNSNEPPEAAKPAVEETKPETESTTTSTSTGSTTTQAPTGVAVGPGGAQTGSSSDEEEETRKPAKKPKPKAEAKVSTPDPKVETKVDAAGVKVDADPQPVAKPVSEPEEPVSSFAVQTMSSTAEMRTSAVTTVVTPPAVPSLRLWPTAFDPGTLVTYVGGLVSSVVSAVLSPFAAGLPSAPADPPTVWTLLAWVRRELFNGSPSITPVINPQTNGLITGNIGAVDPDGDPLTYTVIGTPHHGGTPQIDQGGHFTYRPLNA